MILELGRQSRNQSTDTLSQSFTYSIVVQSGLLTVCKTQPVRHVCEIRNGNFKSLMGFALHLPGDELDTAGLPDSYSKPDVAVGKGVYVMSKLLEGECVCVLERQIVYEAKLVLQFLGPLTQRYIIFSKSSASGLQIIDVQWRDRLIGGLRRRGPGFRL